MVIKLNFLIYILMLFTVNFASGNEKNDVVNQNWDYFMNSLVKNFSENQAIVPNISKEFSMCVYEEEVNLVSFNDGRFQYIYTVFSLPEEVREANYKLIWNELTDKDDWREVNLDIPFISILSPNLLTEKHFSTSKVIFWGTSVPTRFVIFQKVGDAILTVEVEEYPPACENLRKLSRDEVLSLLSVKINLS